MPTPLLSERREPLLPAAAPTARNAAATHDTVAWQTGGPHIQAEARFWMVGLLDGPTPGAEPSAPQGAAETAALSRRRHLLSDTD